MAYETTKFRVEYQRKSQVAVYKKGSTSAPVHTAYVDAMNNDEAKRIAASVPGRINIKVLPVIKAKKAKKGTKRDLIRGLNITPPPSFKTTPFLKSKGADADATQANKVRRRKTAKAYGVDPFDKLVPALDPPPDPPKTRADKALEAIEESWEKGEATIGSEDEAVANDQRPTELHVVRVEIIPIPPVKERVQCCPLDDDFDGNCQIHLSAGVLRNPLGSAGRITSAEPDTYAEDTLELLADDALDELEGQASLKKRFLVGLLILAVAVISSCYYLHTLTLRVESTVLVSIALTCLIVGLVPSKQR